MPLVPYYDKVTVSLYPVGTNNKRSKDYVYNVFCIRSKSNSILRLWFEDKQIFPNQYATLTICR